MAGQYDTAADDWAFKCTGVISAGYSGGGTCVGIDLYSRNTGFLGHSRFWGAGIDLGVAAGITLTDWSYLDVNQAFSPRDLHGAKGSVKCFGAGVLLGSNNIFGTAHKRRSTSYLFEDAQVGSVGFELGLNLGYCWGQWYITSCWTDALPPKADM